MGVCAIRCRSRHGNNAIWSDDPACKHYGDLSAHEDAIRRYVKPNFADLKEKQIKDLLDRSTWLAQKQTLLKARQLQQAIGTAQNDDMNDFDDVFAKLAKRKASSSTPKRKSRSPMPSAGKIPPLKKSSRRFTKPRPTRSMACLPSTAR